jgi:hypothetical protein
VSGLAVMLIAMGVADVFRRRTDRVWLPAAVAPVVVVVCAVLAGLWHLGDIALLVIAAVASVGWVLLCARAERSGEHELAPLAVFHERPRLHVVQRRVHVQTRSLAGERLKGARGS